MDGAGWRGDFDITFRQNVLYNVIIEALKEWARNSQDPNIIHKINDIAIKFEQRIFEKATSKDDYVAKIHQRLNQAKSKLVDVLTTPTTGNQLTISMIQRHVSLPYHAQPNFDGTCLPLDKQSILPSQLHSSHNPMVTSMQQRDMGIQPSLNGFHQDWQMGHQNAPIQNDFQHTSMYQQNMLMKDPYGTQHNMFNMDNCQRSVGVLNQVGNGLASQMAHMGSSSQLLQTMLDSQERRNQFQDISRLQGSHISSIPQSQMAATKAPGAFSSFPDSEGTNTVDWHVLITQFQRMRSAYLPELIKFLEKAEVQCAHAQSIEQFQKSQRAKVVVGKMISFLQMKEREIMVHPKEKLIYFMNQITQFIRRNVKSNNTKSNGNQALQFSSSNHPQMGGFKSSSSVNQGIPYLQSSASNSVLYGSCNTTQQMNMQSLMYQSPGGTVDHSHHKLKQNIQPNNSSSINQVYLEMLLSGNSQNSTQKKDDHSMLNPTSAVFQHNFSRAQFSRNASEGRPLPMQASQPSPIHLDQENDTSSFSNLGGSSLLKTSVFTLDSPSTPITPSSVSKEKIEKPVQCAILDFSARKNEGPQNSGEARTNQDEREMKAVASVTPEIPPEATKQLSLVEKKPIERLIEAVEAMSQEDLLSSIDDIASVISTLDRLADVDLANFPIYNSRAMECNIDGHTPVKVKRAIDSSNRDASMILDDNNYLFTCAAKSCMKRLKIESHHGLLDEIRKINQQLVETIVELASDSMNDDNTKVEASEGTIVRCTYKAVVLSETFKRLVAPATPVSALSVEFLVPSDYPNSPPQCLDKLPIEWRRDNKDLIEKAKLRFNRCLRGLEQPMSLAEMARAWDDCARSVVSEFALCVGAETFSSKYGSWECVPAA